jgi:hypothetical protein
MKFMHRHIEAESPLLQSKDYRLKKGWARMKDRMAMVDLMAPKKVWEEVGKYHLILGRTPEGYLGREGEGGGEGEVEVETSAALHLLD